MVIYLVIFLKLSGMFGPVKTGEGERRSQRRIRAVARRMLYFPMAYCLLSTPVFVLLIITSKGTLIAHDPVVVAGTAFNMIGCVDGQPLVPRLSFRGARALISIATNSSDLSSDAQGSLASEERRRTQPLGLWLRVESLLNRGSRRDLLDGHDEQGQQRLSPFTVSPHR